MIRGKSEKKIKAPLEVIWNWVKDLENILSVIPRVEIIKMEGERKALVRGVLFRGILNLPDEIIAGETKTVEINEDEKYTRSVTESEIFKVETFLKCEKLSENKTNVQMKFEGGFKGLAGGLLEKILFLPLISKLTLSEEIDKILKGLGDSLEEHMRRKWHKKLEKKIKNIEISDL